MARTQLLRSIVRLASQYRVADQAGLEVESIRESQDHEVLSGQRALTRRRFLAGSATAAAALALPQRSFGSLVREPRIAIVGAGVSGLNCALALADKGMRSTVYEASSRIGGRMFSNANGYWSDHQVTEWCGELIDTDHVTIQKLAARFGLVLDDLTAAEPLGSKDTCYFDKGYYPHAQLLKDFAPVHQAVVADSDAAGYPTTWQSHTPAGLKLDAMSVWDWIESRVPGGHASKLGQLLDVAYTIEYGGDTTEQSALNLVYLLSGSNKSFQIFGASDERYHVRGGNQQIPSAIAAHLATLDMPVMSGRSLTAIRRRSDGAFALTFEKGGVLQDELADLVVLTLPFAVLRTLDYSRAGFDDLKDKAIQQLGRGRNGKLQLQFKQRLWNESGAWGIGNGASYSDTGYQNTWEPTRGQSGSLGVLNDYTGGKVTALKQTKAAFAYGGNPNVHADAKVFLNQIQPVFPGLPQLWNGKATSSLPHLSPLFNCSYSFWRVSQYHTIAGYEGVRQGNVFFAGEHTSQDYQGFMEGAASEGKRAAREILKQLGMLG